jgi:hypothetical protein
MAQATARFLEFTTATRCINLTPFAFRLSLLRPAGEWSMRSIGIALSILFLTMSASYGQLVWCEGNCVTLCNKIFRARNSALCIAHYQCSQYAGNQCASNAYVNARATVHCREYPSDCVGETVNFPPPRNGYGR